MLLAYFVFYVETHLVLLDPLHSNSVQQLLLAHWSRVQMQMSKWELRRVQDRGRVTYRSTATRTLASASSLPPL